MSSHETLADPEFSLAAIVRQWFTASGAMVVELDPCLSATAVLAHLQGSRHLLFLDSADQSADSGPSSNDEPKPAAEPAAKKAPASQFKQPPPMTHLSLSRFSFVAADPIHSVVVPPSHDRSPAGVAAHTEALARAFDSLRQMLAELSTPTIPGLPPFQGGVAGLVSYECGLVPLAAGASFAREPAVPLISLHIYDVVFAFDHELGRAWIISQGLPKQGPAARRLRARERLESFLSRRDRPDSAGSPLAPPEPGGPPENAITPLYKNLVIRSTHSPQSYREMVQAGIELVRAGDIFQANLSQRFFLAAAINPLKLYLRSRLMNPAPFAGYFAAGSVQIASMSPERFLQVVRGTVRMHPIKGTRRIIASPEADLYAGDDLGASQKDRAENIMIVDLVRNDLSRVCTAPSVRVESLCQLERYRYVQHLVSIVSGRLQRGLTALDALLAALPGGSVTGAPKHRACEIISQLEAGTRGAYCGSLGYIGFDANADFNLLIRTFVMTGDSIEFSVGGGITAQSDPAAEYAETLHKAEGMLRVLASFGVTGYPADKPFTPGASPRAAATGTGAMP